MRLAGKILVPILLCSACATVPLPEPPAEGFFRQGDYARAALAYETQAASEASPELAARHLFRAALSYTLSAQTTVQDKGLALLLRLQQDSPKGSFGPLARQILDLHQELAEARADTAEGNRLVRHLVKDTVRLQETLEETEAGYAAEREKLGSQITALEAKIRRRDQKLQTKEELILRLRREIEELKRIDMDESIPQTPAADHPTESP